MDKSISIGTSASITSNVSTTTSMDKIDQAASWLSATVISAFFASLERCACVNLSTSHDDEDEDDEESYHRPLALSAAPHPNDTV